MRDEGDDVGLDVEQVGVDLEEGGEVLRGLEQGGPQVDVEVVGHKLEQLVHMQGALQANLYINQLSEYDSQFLGSLLTPNCLSYVIEILISGRKTGFYMPFLDSDR